MTRPDVVDLVGEVLAEFRGVQQACFVPGEPLNIAVAVAVDRGAGERVVRGDRAVAGDAQDLAGEVGALGVRGVARVARGHVQHAVGAERDAPAVAGLAPGDAGEDHLLGRGSAEPEAHHPIVGGRADVRVDELVLRERGGERDAEQASLTSGVHVRDRGHRYGRSAGTHPRDGRGVAFGDQGAAVGEEGHAPGHPQPGSGDLCPGEVEPARPRDGRLGHDERRGGDHGAKDDGKCRRQVLGHHTLRGGMGRPARPHRKRPLRPGQSSGGHPFADLRVCRRPPSGTGNFHHPALGRRRCRAAAGGDCGGGVPLILTIGSITSERSPRWELPFGPPDRRRQGVVFWGQVRQAATDTTATAALSITRGVTPARKGAPRHAGRPSRPVSGTPR